MILHSSGASATAMDAEAPLTPSARARWTAMDLPICICSFGGSAASIGVKYALMTSQ